MDLTRREVIVTGAAAALSATAARADGGETARGVVRSDAAPIGGVMVSNGRDIVRTGADGSWALPVRDGDSVFVIKPRDWMVPLQPHTQLPRFAYVHAPHGTPSSLGLRYAGLAPTGPLPDSIDFVLQRSPEPDRFRVLLFTDPQPESDEELTYVRDTAIALAGAEPAAFGITTGDVMFDDLSLYGRNNRLVGSLGLPWWNVCGNHDMNYEAPDNQYSRETFKRIFGARHYAFQYGPATFIMLDNVEYLGGNKYQGRIGADQMAFVTALLAEVPHDALLVVCMHIPLQTAVGTEPFSATVNAASLLELLADRPHCISFAGHTHTNEHHYIGASKHHHHVLTAVSGSWWSGPYAVNGIPVALASDGAPNGFHVLSIDGNDARTRLVQSVDPAAAPLRVILDAHFARKTPDLAAVTPLPDLLGGSVAVEAVGAARLVVNFFVGGPRSAVHYEIGGRRIDMAPSLEVDPYVQQVYWRNASTKKPWVQPVKSTHLWHAPLPADLGVGAHRVAVSAVDEFGAVFETGFVVEVTA